MITKPMLAATVKDVDDLRYPLIATPKLDGIRCITTKKGPVSRALKSIRNEFVRTLLSGLPAGADGELCLRKRGATFREVSSAIMSKDGEPDFVYHIFDFFSESAYQVRIQRMLEEDGLVNPVVKFVPSKWIHNREQLDRYEAQMLKRGYEGVMLRDPDGPYKFGRSTWKEHYLLKLKRFKDSEAKIVKVYEQEENRNAAKKNALGQTERSSHKAHKVGKGTLGGFEVEDPLFVKPFNIGTGRGLTKALRDSLWKDRENLIGRLVKYRYQDHGVKDAPRFPIFLGFRDVEDL